MKASSGYRERERVLRRRSRLRDLFRRSLDRLRDLFRRSRDLERERVLFLERERLRLREREREVRRRREREEDRRRDRERLRLWVRLLLTVSFSFSFSSFFSTVGLNTISSLMTFSCTFSFSATVWNYFIESLPPQENLNCIYQPLQEWLQLLKETVVLPWRDSQLLLSLSEQLHSTYSAESACWWHRLNGGLLNKQLLIRTS